MSEKKRESFWDFIGDLFESLGDFFECFTDLDHHD